MNTLNFKLTGLTCESCVKLASNRLKKVPGVKEVTIDLASGDTQISSEIILDLENLDKSLEGTHYSIVK